MKHRELLLLCSALIPLPLPAADISPRDFAFGLPVTTQNDAPAYRIAVPFVLYQNTFSENLGDIRVFNSDGEVVPYSSLRRAATQPPAAAVQLPMFALQTGARAMIDGVRVTIVGPGAAVNLQSQTSQSSGVSDVRYILDGRDLKAKVEAMRLDWADTEVDFSGRVRIEASDDLNDWRMITAGAPVVNLRAGSQSIIQNRIVIPRTAAQFWRLSWVGAPPAFKIAAISAEPADTPAEPMRAAVDVIGIEDPANSQDLTFDLGAHAPVDRVNLVLPDVNTVANIKLFSRRSPREPWRDVSRAGFFRVATADGEIQNEPVRVSIDRDRYWKARLLATGGFSQKPLFIRVQWIPDEVIFLARGHGPFLLAYGNSSAPAAETDLSSLPSEVVIEAAGTRAFTVLGGPSRLADQPAGFPRGQFALWAVLLLAVLGLAWMAFQLMKENRAAA